MKAGKTVSMDIKVWSDISEIADLRYEGDVNAAIEHVCREGLRTIETGD